MRTCLNLKRSIVSRELEVLASPVLGGLYENGGGEEDGIDDEL